MVLPKPLHNDLPVVITKENEVMNYFFAGVKVDGQPATVQQARCGAEFKVVNGNIDLNELALRLHTSAKLGDKVEIVISLQHANYVEPTPPKTDEITDESSTSVLASLQSSE